ncbi:MAG: hypothetical protein JNK77_17500 [Saprospiraceae bacterium]|nr:hypothetical protein [Saprospiraceae bacterium]
MKNRRFLLSLWLSLFCFLSSLSAQNAPECLTLYTEPEQADAGAQVCIPVKVRDFSNIISAQYTHRWDPALLEWESIIPGDLPSVSIANFGIVSEQLEAGQLTFAWFDPMVQGLSLPDDATLYEICFNVTGSAGQYADIYFDGTPTSVEFVGGQLHEIERYSLLGSGIAIGLPDAPLSISSGCIEGVLCGSSSTSFSIEVEGADPPFSYTWTGPGGFGATSQNPTVVIPGTYNLTVTASNGSSARALINVPGGELLVGVSYQCEIINDTAHVEISSLVWTGGAPPYVFQWSNGETDTSDQLASTNVILPGTFGVTVTDQSGCEFIDDQIAPQCGSVQMLTAYSYECILENDEWTANISVVVWDGGVAPYTFMWNTGESTTGDFFSTITGPGNQEYSVTIVDALGNTYVPEPAAPNCGAPNDTDVELRFETPVSVVPPDGIICLDIVADNFEDMVSAQFSVQWDPEAFAFDHIEPADLPGVGLANFGDNPFWLDQGKLGFHWLSLLVGSTNLSYSLPDGGVLFRLCLRALDDAAGNTTEVSFGEVPTPFEFIRLGDTPVPFGFSSQTLFIDDNPAPEFLLLQAGDELVAAGESVCVPVSAVIFNDILSLQFSMAWDTGLLHFSSVQPLDWSGIGAGNFGLAQVDEGSLSFAWYDPDLGGETLPTGTALFEVCFESTGIPGVSPLAFTQSPTPFEAYNTDDILVPFAGYAGSITIVDLIVWPGNADNDALVNHFDLLPIGLAYGATGPQRPNADISWTAQGAPGWQQTTPNSLINYAHIDTDGDGAIDAADTSALVQNWGQLPGFGLLAEEDKQLPLSASLLNSAIYVQPDTMTFGEAATLQIILGDDDNPAVDVYGIAFSIVYDENAIVAGSVHATFADSWMREPGGDLLTVAREDTGNHRIDIAISRIDGLNTSGSGPVGQLHLTIEDVIFMRQEAYEMAFSIENVQLINAQEEALTLAPVTTTSLVGTATGTNNPSLGAQVRVFPSPTSDRVWIKADDGLDVQQAVLYTSTGQIVDRWNRPESSLALGRLPAGIYRLAIITDKGVVHKSVVKN